MKTMKLMSFAMAVLFALLLSNTVQAQEAAFVTFEGIEISSGHQTSGEAYGWMCYAKTTGTLPGNLTLSIDYSGFKIPGTSTDVIGGAWTLPIYGAPRIDLPAKSVMRGDHYQGVLFGSVEGGSVTFDESGLGATVALKMSIKGGTQTMAAVTGTAFLSGNVIYDEKTGIGTFDGTMYFDFQ